MNSFFNETLSVIQAIQLILAPAVMINACGLLLLGISNKFSNILNRIRLLTQEKLGLLQRAAERQLSTIEQQRIENINRQLDGLLERARLVRNAVACYFISVGIFVATSLFIGVDFFFHLYWLRNIIIGMFLLGMVTVFISVVFGVKDTLKGYRIVRVEVETNG